MKPSNNFQENYKNRRKLKDKVSKKSPRHHSPLQINKDSKEKER